jgi:transcriptional regulator with XRE-family HTH domain
MSTHFPDTRYAFILGEDVRARRQQIGLSIAQAAELSGMESFRWAQMEMGCWIPEERNWFQSIADTLEVNIVEISFRALVSRENQPR